MDAILILALVGAAVYGVRRAQRWWKRRRRVIVRQLTQAAVPVLGVQVLALYAGNVAGIQLGPWAVIVLPALLLGALRHQVAAR
jgi:hypothetical protein